MLICTSCSFLLIRICNYILLQNIRGNHCYVYLYSWCRKSLSTWSLQFKYLYTLFSSYYRKMYDFYLIRKYNRIILNIKNEIWKSHSDNKMLLSMCEWYGFIEFPFLWQNIWQVCSFWKCCSILFFGYLRPEHLDLFSCKEDLLFVTCTFLGSYLYLLLMYVLLFQF